jgi:acetyl-CoA acetyltransferase
VVLVVGAEVQTTVSARKGADYLATASWYSQQRGIDDFVFPAVFANKIRAAIESGMITTDDLASVSRKAYNNAALNPLAHMHAVGGSPAGTDADVCFLSNPELKPFVRLSDCSQVCEKKNGLC